MLVSLVLVLSTRWSLTPASPIRRSRSKGGGVVMRRVDNMCGPWLYNSGVMFVMSVVRCRSGALPPGQMTYATQDTRL